MVCLASRIFAEIVIVILAATVADVSYISIFRGVLIFGGITTIAILWKFVFILHVASIRSWYSLSMRVIVLNVKKYLRYVGW